MKDGNAVRHAALWRAALISLDHCSPQTHHWFSPIVPVANHFCSCLVRPGTVRYVGSVNRARWLREKAGPLAVPAAKLLAVPTQLLPWRGRSLACVAHRPTVVESVLLTLTLRDIHLVVLFVSIHCALVLHFQAPHTASVVRQLLALAAGQMEASVRSPRAGRAPIAASARCRGSAVPSSRHPSAVTAACSLSCLL